MEFIYKLVLTERLTKKSKWTDLDEKIVQDHYNHLLRLKNSGFLILAGKTAGLDKDTYGLVIFKAKDYNEALSIMQSDPAVKKGIMIGYLQEYNVAIINGEYKKE